MLLTETTAVISDMMSGFITEADWTAASGSDSGICEKALKRGGEAEGQGAAGEGLRNHEGRRRGFAQFIRQYGKHGAAA